ncbi:hypothetical protein K466DRAFT_588487, partial [Polyporus arcularius HHB13444]
MRFSLSVVLAMAASVLAQGDPIVIDTPASAVQCQTTLVTWTGGVAPFNLSIVHDRTAEHYNGLTERTFAWNTDLPANTDLFFFIIDSTSHTGQSSLFLIQPSEDSSCL